MWYKLKRIMIRPNGVEKQVRPKKLHLTSDLRWATLAWLQSQWWAGIAYRYNTYTLNSSWLTPSKSQRNDVAFLYVNYPDLSSNDIIKCKVTWTLTRLTTASCCIWYMSSSLLTFPSAFSSELRCFYISATEGVIHWIVYNDSTVIWTQPWATAWWNFDLTTEINLQTGFIEYKLTSPISFTTSGTLTNAQLGNVLTYKNIWVMAQIFNTQETATIHTVDLTIS